jgi:hypothetical protein
MPSGDLVHLRLWRDWLDASQTEPPLRARRPRPSGYRIFERKTFVRL